MQEFYIHRSIEIREFADLYRIWNTKKTKNYILTKYISNLWLSYPDLSRTSHICTKIIWTQINIHNRCVHTLNKKNKQIYIHKVFLCRFMQSN